MKILLGGIPLGCDNIGDEAIVACVVRMLRESITGVSLAVATRDPATGPLLGVETVPCFGFAGVPADGFAGTVRSFDAYVWCGATGLSDYPDAALDLLETAIRQQVPSFIWAVGMDDELNPAFFKLHGRKKVLFGALGLKSFCERRMERRLAGRIASILPRCSGVWTRDPESARALARRGFPRAKVAADTAILLARDADGAEIPPAEPSLPPVLGFCISAQRRISDMEGARRFVRRVESAGFRVLGIPMNQKTDAPVMEDLGVRCSSAATPQEVSDEAARCSLVLSSRLHLLILAANRGVPVMGIARGSKLANFLANFSKTVEGSVFDCDWDALAEKVVSELSVSVGRPRVRDAAYETLFNRYEEARREFAEALVRCCGGAPADAFPRVSVLVRSFNDEKYIARTLDGIFAQKPAPFEVLVCDDGSTDSTREIASRRPVRFVERPAGAYRPGATLNALVRAAKGDIVVFNNSDAVPLGESWLANLVRPVAGDPLAFAFANQVPRSDAAPLVVKDSLRAFGDGATQSKWGFFFSLASSAARRDMLLETPFDEEIRYSEDVEWTWRNTRRAVDPARTVYCPEARVEHSHNYTMKELARRFRGEGAADARIFGRTPSLLRELLSAAAETLRDWEYLAKNGGGVRAALSAPARRLVQRLSHWLGARAEKY